MAVAARGRTCRSSGKTIPRRQRTTRSAPPTTLFDGDRDWAWSSLLLRCPRIDDKGAQFLIQRHEVGLECHRDRARPAETDAAFVEDAAGPCAHHADASRKERRLAHTGRH